MENIKHFDVIKELRRYKEFDKCNDDNLLYLYYFCVDLFGFDFAKIVSILKASVIENGYISFEELKTICLSCDISKENNISIDDSCCGFLLSLGKSERLSQNDKDIILKLYEEYELSPVIINMIIKHCIGVLNGRLIRHYVFGIASDIKRNGISSKEDVSAFLLNINRDRSYDTGEILKRVCPKCGRDLIIRKGRNGSFIGCSGYPDCDFTDSIDSILLSETLFEIYKNEESSKEIRKIKYYDYELYSLCKVENKTKNILNCVLFTKYEMKILKEYLSNMVLE